jgi:hypothetical protein
MQACVVSTTTVGVPVEAAKSEEGIMKKKGGNGKLPLYIAIGVGGFVVLIAGYLAVRVSTHGQPLPPPRRSRAHTGNDPFEIPHDDDEEYDEKY